MAIRFLEKLKYLPQAIEETIRERKWLPESIRTPLEKVSDFITPDSPEEARKYGIIPVKNRDGSYSYLDPIVMGGMNIVKTAAKETVKKAIQRGTQRLRGVLSKPSAPAKTTVKNLIKKRYSSIKTGLLDSEIFVRDLEKTLTKTEREKIPFIIEKTIKGTPKLQKWASKISEYYDEGHKFLSQNLDNVGFVENYVNRLWDIPKNKSSQVASYFTTKNPFLKERIIPTLREGIRGITLKDGSTLKLKPKTIDIADLLRVYDQYKHTTVANKRFVDGLKNITDEFGEKVVKRIDKAPADWITIDHPALRRAIGIPIEKGKMLIPKIPVKVSPEIAKEVKVILDKPFSGAAVKAIDTVYAFTKKTALSLS